MYYLKSNELMQADVYGYEPDGDYLEIEVIPSRPRDRANYLTRLYADIENNRVWWDYEAIPTAEQAQIEELQEVVMILTGGADDELD